MDPGAGTIFHKSDKRERTACPMMSLRDRAVARSRAMQADGDAVHGGCAEGQDDDKF